MEGLCPGQRHVDQDFPGTGETHIVDRLATARGRLTRGQAESHDRIGTGGGKRGTEVRFAPAGHNYRAELWRRPQACLLTNPGRIQTVRLKPGIHA